MGREPLRADDGIRTRDPHLGKVMLYQLSHVRTAPVRGFRFRLPRCGALRTLTQCFLTLQIESQRCHSRPRHQVLSDRVVAWAARGGLRTRFAVRAEGVLVLLFARAIGAVVARFVHTEEVTGSNPVSPTLDEAPVG